MLARRDSFSILRETMRWRVALVLATLIATLCLVLGLVNTRLGLPDTALLAWIVLACSLGCVAALLRLPRRTGGTVFFAIISVLLVAIMAYGAWHGRPMQHWAYIFPPSIIFLLRARPALIAMLAYGVYASALIAPLVPGIDVVRFASGYGLVVCFMFTYALLQERAADMLRYHSDHDALSNCYNRRTFNEEMAHLAASARASTRCALMLIDIDHFKPINDQHGHLVGDRVITQAAAALGRALDPGIALYRYGGEEFAVMLPEADIDAASALAERMRAGIEAADFQGLRITVSIGVAAWQSGRDALSEALDRADRALYRAKREGRNRVVVDPLHASVGHATTT